MLSLGCERLPTPLKKKKKVLDHYLHRDLGMLPLLRCFFAHLLILQYKLSLGCERLPTPLKKKKKKVLDHYLHRDLGMLPLLRCFFAHLRILQYPDHHQNLISSSLYYSGPVHKISSQSVHNCLSNVVHRQTDKQTDRQTN